MGAFARLTIRAALLLGLIGAGCTPAPSIGSLPPPKATERGVYAPAATVTPTPFEPQVTPSPLPSATVPEPVGFEPASVHYAIPLTVQYVGETRAVYFFELEASSDATLLVWVKGEHPLTGQRISLEGEALGGLFLVENLEPGQSYQAAVVLAEEPGSLEVPGWVSGTWDPTEIQTLPRGGLPIRIAVIGDSGFGEDVTRRLAEGMASHAPDAVIHTGDLVYNVDEEGTPADAFKAKLFDPFAPLLRRSPLYPVPGNHEYYPDALDRDLPYYHHAFPPLSDVLPQEIWAEGGGSMRGWYAFGVGEYQFILLDSQAFYQPRGADEQTQFLEQRLADRRYRASILVFHIPPYTSGRHTVDGLPIQRGWLPALKNSNTILILSGHDHNYERLALDGLTSLVVGGGSSHLYALKERLPESQFFAAVPSYVILDFGGQGVEARAFDEEGVLLDQVFLPLD